MLNLIRQYCLDNPPADGRMNDVFVALICTTATTIAGTYPDHMAHMDRFTHTLGTIIAELIDRLEAESHAEQHEHAARWVN